MVQPYCSFTENALDSLHHQQQVQPPSGPKRNETALSTAIALKSLANHFAASAHHNSLKKRQKMAKKKAAAAEGVRQNQAAVGGHI